MGETSEDIFDDIVFGNKKRPPKENQKSILDFLFEDDESEKKKDGDIFQSRKRSFPFQLSSSSEDSSEKSDTTVEEVTSSSSSSSESDTESEEDTKLFPFRLSSTDSDQSETDSAEKRKSIKKRRYFKSLRKDYPFLNYDKPNEFS